MLKQFQPASKADISHLVELINKAYRSGQGWTTEAALISGLRTNADAIALDFETGHQYWLRYKGDDLVACIACKQENSHIHIGRFAVAPSQQNSGLGKQALLFAEENSLKQWPTSTHFVMDVVSNRPELTAYYERRGYTVTNERMAYPNDASVGTPKIPDIHLLRMMKSCK